MHTRILFEWLNTEENWFEGGMGMLMLVRQLDSMWNCLRFGFQWIRVLVRRLCEIGFDERSASYSEKNLSIWSFGIFSDQSIWFERVKMTSGYSVLQLKDDDVMKILAAQLHVGSKDVDFQMDTYVWKKKPRNDGSIRTNSSWNSLVFVYRWIDPEYSQVLGETRLGCSSYRRSRKSSGCLCYLMPTTR